MADTKPTTTEVLDNYTLANSPTAQIAIIQLDGDNVLCWSQSVRMFIHGQGTVGYITREKIAYSPADPLFAKSDAETICATLQPRNYGIALLKCILIWTNHKYLI